MSTHIDDKVFLQDVVASVTVPASPTATLAEMLQDISEVEQRQTLYFDERLRLLVNLDFPHCTEQKLASYLKKLELRVDAWAIGTQNGEEKPPVDGAPTRDLIASKHVQSLQDPFTIVRQADDDEHGQRILLAWEVEVTLARPRLRSLEQSVIFLAIATIIESEKAQDASDFLEPFSIIEPNVLGSLHSIDGADDVYLPISRLEKVVPRPPKKDNRIRLKYRASHPTRAYAAVMPRLKYNRINTALPNPTTIASLDLEMIPFIDVKGAIESIDVSMANGKAVSLMPDFLPMPCKSKDCITFLYNLQSAQQSGTHTPADPLTPSTPTSSPNTNLNVDILSISISIKLDISPTTTANIQMSWTTNVDFSLALNPAFGAPAQPLQRTNRPTSLNFSPYPDPNKSRDRTASVRAASTSLQHQVIPQSLPRQLLTSILSVSFVAPDDPARVGVPFVWRVLIVNNSPKPAKLAIVPLPRIQRPTNPTQHFQKRHAPKTSDASVLPASALAQAGAKRHTKNATSTAKAVVEEQVLYALHHQAPSAGASAVPVETDLISLTAEIRVGPLGVGQCHETEIKFVAYKTGVFSVDAIRIVDLAKENEGGVGVINDIRELPEVVVIESESCDEVVEEQDD